MGTSFKTGMILSVSIGAMQVHLQNPVVTELIVSRLAQQEVRYTAARRLVVQALVDATGPLTAADLDQALSGEVPLSSLYRTLAVLEDVEVLHRQHDADGIARYELAEWLKGHHHHLVCTECGTVVDVTISPELEERVEEIVKDLATEHRWSASGHRIDIEGVCPACREN